MTDANRYRLAYLSARRRARVAVAAFLAEAAAVRQLESDDNMTANEFDRLMAAGTPVDVTVRFDPIWNELARRFGQDQVHQFLVMLMGAAEAAFHDRDHRHVQDLNDFRDGFIAGAAYAPRLEHDYRVVIEATRIAGDPA